MSQCYCGQIVQHTLVTLHHNSNQPLAWDVVCDDYTTNGLDNDGREQVTLINTIIKSLTAFSAVKRELYKIGY